MSDPLNIGGVSYQADQVKNHTAETKTRVDDSGKASAFTTYEVEMSDGTKLSYETQPAEREASVFQEIGQTKFFGLTNTEITDTPRDDVYKLFGCEFTRVSAKRTTEEGILSKDIVSADSDQIIVKDRIMENGEIQTSHHNAFYLNGRTNKKGKRDAIQLQDDNQIQKANTFKHFQLNERKAENIK